MAEDITIAYDDYHKLWAVTDEAEGVVLGWYATEEQAKREQTVVEGNPGETPLPDDDDIQGWKDITWSVTNEGEPDFWMVRANGHEYTRVFSEAEGDNLVETYRAELEALEGNPGEGTLHDMLSDVADHIDYEADVVAEAAEDIEDKDISEAAEDQAEAMEEAAEAVEDAADAARETAAEVFNETGIAQTDPKPDQDLQEVVSGNPSSWDGYSVQQEDNDTWVVVKDSAQVQIHDTESDARIGAKAAADTDKWLRGELGSGGEVEEVVVKGNPILDKDKLTGEDVEAVEWKNVGRNRGLEFVESGGNPDDAPDPLSGEFAGESIPEIFGSWDNATERNQEAYEDGYNEAIQGNPGEEVVSGNPVGDIYRVKFWPELAGDRAGKWSVVDLEGTPTSQKTMSEEAAKKLAEQLNNQVVGGNPGEEVLPVTELVPIEAPTPNPEPAADIAPEPSHWYTKQLFGKVNK